MEKSDAMAFDYSTLENQPGIVSPYELNEDQYAATLDPRRGGDLAEGMCTHVPALCGLIHHQIKAIDRIMQNVCNCECKIAKQVSKVITSPPSPPPPPLGYLCAYLFVNHIQSIYL